MQFNVKKCVTLRCDKSLQRSSFTYYLNGEPLNCVTDHSYLGILLSSSISFSPHINNIVVKASKMLNFILRNLSKCSKEVKSTAYLSLVCPILEYSSSVWDRPEPNMLKILSIIPSSTSQKNYLLFLFYSQIITYYSHIILLLYCFKW